MFLQSIFTSYLPAINILFSFQRFQESNCKCDVSGRNTLAFVSAHPLTKACSVPNEEEEHPLLLPMHQRGKDKFAGGFNSTSDSTNNAFGKYFVYVADLNTPWDVHLVTSTSYEISTLKWDMNNGNSLVFADISGQVEVWQMKEFLLSDWHCIHKSVYKSEVFLTVFSIGSGRRTYINMDKDPGYYHDKFNFRPAPSIAQGFGERDMFGLLLVSHTGLVVCLAIPTNSSNVLEAKHAKQCLNNVTRNRVRTVDVSFVKDGSLLIAASNGNPLDPIRFYKVAISWIDCAFDDGLELGLNLETFPGLCTRRAEGEKSEDRCLALVDLCFVSGDDTDSILVATTHPAGGRLELWELKEFQQNVHKMFLSAGASMVGDTSSFSLPAWHYVEKFSGPVSQIVSVATSQRCFQSGRAAACYVTVAYSDGSIQCLIR